MHIIMGVLVHKFFQLITSQPAIQFSLVSTHNAVNFHVSLAGGKDKR